MEAQYWQEKWDANQIGFHQSDVNKRLIEFWPQIVQSNSNADSTPCVFVPLCGKSLDMLWLHKQGFHVLGAELSEKAVKAFYTENQLPFKLIVDGDFKRYSGIDSADGLDVLVGDFFAIKNTTIAHCLAFYDRAALIAMNPDMRSDYARQLATLAPVGARGLLLAISYDQARMQGPPFSVSDENARELLSENFEIEELAHYHGANRLGNLADRGLETLHERAYLLRRK